MIAWATRRPATVWAAAAALLLAGGVAFSRLPLATRPRVELPRLRIAAQWPGASAELVESYLTAPIEAAVQGVRGVATVSSQSDEGSAQLTVELEQDANVQLTRLAILERLELLRDEFPPGAAAPSVGNYVPESLAEQPLLRYTVSGPYTAGTLARLVRERVNPRLAAVPGVGDVQVSGGAEVGVAVAYDAPRLRQLDLAPDALRDALQAAQLRRPLGEDFTALSQRPVVFQARATTLGSLAELPVRSQDGRVFRLGDLAAVRFEEDARDFFYRVNGEPAVGLTISRLAGADAIRTAALVRQAMAELAAELPVGVRFRIQSDESVDLVRQLDALLLRGGIACVTVMLVLVLALRNAKSVIMVFGSALVAVAGTALGLYLLDIPANLLTLAGLGMGIGILVQNGVVVVERLRSAPDTAEGRAGAARRITPAVLGATLTTAVVLLPFLYLQGNARAAFTPFAVAFALALGWSVISALVMIPALGAGHGLRTVVWPRLLRFYSRSVMRLLRWRWGAVALVAGLIGVVGWQFFEKVPRFDYGSWWGRRATLSARLSFPRGSDPTSLDHGIREFERIVVGREGVDQVVSQGSRDGAWLQVTFARGAELTAIPYVLQEELTQRAIYIGGAQVSVYYQGPGYSSGGGGGIPQYRIKLLGYSYGGVERIALDLKRRLERIPRVQTVDINAGRFWGREKAFAVTLEPDRAALARYALSARDLADAVTRQVSGPVGGTRLEVDGEELRVTLKAAGAERRTLRELRDALVSNAAGAPVRIGDVATVGERETLARIDREDQQYVRTVSYEFRGPSKLGQRTHESFLASIAVPPGYWAGEDDWYWGRDDSGKGLWLVFAAGLVLVILAVAMVFDSVWASAIVFLSLPVALTGSAAAFWIAGAAFTREAAVGVILVVGLAVNQAILLMDAALARRRSSDRRVRPLGGADVVRVARDRAGMIVLVTCTTLASLLPLAVGTDPDELFGAIALATAGGTVAGTIGALWVVPLLVLRWPVSGAWLRALRSGAWWPVLLGMTGAAACTGAEGGGPWRGSVDTLPSGTIVVRNEGGQVWDSSTAWRLVEDLRIGTAGEGPASFGPIVALEADRLGRIYVVDRQAQEIRVFDSTGAFVRRIGRPGKGPGEFVGANGLDWTPDGRLWVMDEEGVRITVFDTSGRYVASRQRPGPVFYGWYWNGSLDTAGRLVDRSYRRVGRQSEYFLVRHDTMFHHVDTFPLPECDRQRCPGPFEFRRPNATAYMPVPYATSLVTTLDPRGHVWFAITDEYRIYQRRLEGDTVRIIERATRPIEVTAAELDSVVEPLAEAAGGEAQVDRSRIPRTKPAATGLFLDDAGRVWVRPSVAGAASPDVADVFGPDGRYLGRVALPFPVQPRAPVIVRGTRFYAVTEDANGVPYVVRARIERGGGGPAR